MVRVIQAGCVCRMALALLSLLICADAAALWCDSDRSRSGCNGTGESAEWRLEYVDIVTSEHPGYYIMRAIRKPDGTSTMLRVSTRFDGARGSDPGLPVSRPWSSPTRHAGSTRSFCLTLRDGSRSPASSPTTCASRRTTDTCYIGSPITPGRMGMTRGCSYWICRKSTTRR